MQNCVNHRPFEQWPELTEYATNVSEINPNSDRALLYREKKSYRGISSLQNLKKLKASQVDQGFLEEICQLPDLEYLELYTVSASDLTPLKNLRSLKTLRLDIVSKAEDFTSLAEMTWLDALMISHAKHLSDLSFLSNADHLRYLGVEGAMWTAQKIESLKPLMGLKKLEYLFMSSIRLQDKKLTYLAAIKNLKVLDCARFAPKASFDDLHSLMPLLECRWCDSYKIT